MPYISQRSRRSLDPTIDAIPVRGATAGELNYIITRILLRWLREGFAGYAERALAVGILETAKLEFYRRSLGPFEDTKREINGDVYDNKVEEDGADRGAAGYSR